ncbi:MAG: DNA internalization-related competence protein ComEC/Rec2 [Raoultibacter sp.]|jgi:competence protein ComEC
MNREHAFPVRISPTLIFFCSLGLWAGAAFILVQNLNLSNLAMGLFFGVLLLVISILAILLLRVRKTNKQIILVIMLGLCVGLVCGQAYACVAHDKQNLISESKPSGKLFFEIVEDERKSDFGSTYTAKTILETGEEVSVSLRMKADAPSLHYGQIISASTRISVPSESSAQYLWSKGIIAVADIYSFELCERSDGFALLVSFREKALSGLDSEEGVGKNLLRAILFGERSMLDEGGFYQDIRAVGLAHLVAVSGAHLVIVSASLQALLSLLRVPRRAMIACQLVFIVGYLVLTAMPISAIRAACMTTVSLLSFYGRRRSSSLNGLGVCIIVLIVLNPQTAISISFLLSSLATLGIIVLASLFTHWIHYFIPRLPSSIVDSVSLTLSASVLVSPVVAALFSQISIISPLMNVIAAPCFTVLCVGGLFITAFSVVMPTFAALPLELLTEASGLFCQLIALIAEIPYVAIPAQCDFLIALSVSFTLLTLLWCFWPKPAGVKLALVSIGSSGALIVFLVVAPLCYSDEVIMLDVGQGDSFLIRSQGATVLIDTGNKDSALLQGLGRHGVAHLDALLISHADDDHCGSLPALRSLVDVDSVCVAADVLACDCASCGQLVSNAKDLVGEQGLTALEVGDSLKVGSFDFEVVWPDEFKDEGGNADSLSLLMTRKNTGNEEEGSSSVWSMLFCGDAEYEQVEEMIDKDRIGKIDIYKVGHHGSKNALSEELVEVLRPRLSLVSVGQNNRYGHPAEETIALLESVGSEIVRSDEEGDVVCKFEADRLELSSLR